MSAERSSATVSASLLEARAAQRRWRGASVGERLRVIRRLRRLVAEDPLSLAKTVPLDVAGALHRTLADTLVTEVLPLIEGCKWLESEAPAILRPQRLSAWGRSVWLGRIAVAIHREPHGVVLVIGPANYPLFLPGAQALQALVAGNAVLWKPAHTGALAAQALSYLLREAGLDPALLQVLEAAPEAAQHAIAAGVDKVVLTGHVETGRAVLRQCAERVTPATLELSGCDAVFVLPGADLERAAKALAFGLRLNGSATCMAPRRLFVAEEVAEELLAALMRELRRLPAAPLTPRIAGELRDLLADAEACGAAVLADGLPAGPPPDGLYRSLRYALILGATPEMRVAEADVFAPILSVFRYSDERAALEAHDACPYALTAAIFGPERAAARLSHGVRAGTVIVNDVIVPTADPRAPFGGRGQSGYGVTRGREGLLAMTAPKAVVTQRSRSERAYAPTTEAHAELFAALLRAGHGQGWRGRLAGLRALATAARRFTAQPKPMASPERQVQEDCD